jgi:hypothetical protein
VSTLNYYYDYYLLPELITLLDHIIHTSDERVYSYAEEGNI